MLKPLPSSLEFDFDGNEMHRLDIPLKNEVTTAEFERRYAFSLGTRNKIRDRVRSKYKQLCSEISQKNDRPLEAAHLDHNKKSYFYDHPDIGWYITDIEHLAHHLYYRKSPNQIGLSRKDNEFAIRECSKRALEYSLNLGVSVEAHVNLIGEALAAWHEYLIAEV